MSDIGFGAGLSRVLAGLGVSTLLGPTVRTPGMIARRRRQRRNWRLGLLRPLSGEANLRAPAFRVVWWMQLLAARQGHRTLRSAWCCPDGCGQGA